MRQEYTAGKNCGQVNMEFLSLSRRRSSSLNSPSGEERRETAVFAMKTSSVMTLTFSVLPITVTVLRLDWSDWSCLKFILSPPISLGKHWHLRIS